MKLSYDEILAEAEGALQIARDLKDKVVEKGPGELRAVAEALKSIAQKATDAIEYAATALEEAGPHLNFATPEAAQAKQDLQRVIDECRAAVNECRAAHSSPADAQIEGRVSPESIARVFESVMAILSLVARFIR